MLAWSAADTVAHASPKVIGSKVNPIPGSPAVGRMVCGAAELKLISPGAIEPQLGAEKGPPEAAELGQVWVSV